MMRGALAKKYATANDEFTYEVMLALPALALELTRASLRSMSDELNSSARQRKI